MAVLFSVLERAVIKNDVFFWKELFANVLYPILEDINLAVETKQE